MSAIGQQQRHETTLTELYRAVDSEDWERLSGLYHDQIRYERPGYEPFLGKGEVLDFYLHDRAIASGRHQLEGIVSTGPRTVCWGRFDGRLKDGTDVSVPFADVYLFEGRRIIFRKTFFFRAVV